MQKSTKHPQLSGWVKKEQRDTSSLFYPTKSTTATGVCWADSRQHSPLPPSTCSKCWQQYVSEQKNTGYLVSLLQSQQPPLSLPVEGNNYSWAQEGWFPCVQTHCPRGSPTMHNSSGNNSSLLPGNHSIDISRKTVFQAWFQQGNSGTNQTIWTQQPSLKENSLGALRWQWPLLSYSVQHFCCAWFFREGQGWQHGLPVVGAFTHQTLRGSTVPGKSGMSCLDTSLRASPEHKHS